MTAAPCPWKLAGRRAELSLGELSAVVNVDRPGLGVEQIARSGAPLKAIRHVLALTEPGPRQSDVARPIEDCYVRGRDLVAVYAESPAHPLRYVVYWRALAGDELCGAAAGLDLVVSVQTSVLDATPTAVVGSELSAETVFRLAAPRPEWIAVPPRHLEAVLDEPRHAAELTNAAAGARDDDAFLCDLPNSDWSYAEMIHPQDRMQSDALVLAHEEPADAGRVAAASFVHTSHRVLGLRLEKGVLLRARLRAIFVPRQAARDLVLASRDQFHRAELPLAT